MRRIILGSLVVALVVSGLFLSSNSIADGMRVKVVVGSGFTNSSQLKSFITRELRTFPDVDVVEQDEGFGLNVVGMDLKYADGSMSPSAAFSFLFTRRFHPEGLIESVSVLDNMKLSEKLSGDKNEDYRVHLAALSVLSIFLDAYKNTTAFEHYTSMATWKVENMKALAAGIVANFDTRMLEPTRQWGDQIKSLDTE